MEETHSFRLIETTDITQLTLHHRPDGQVLVPWEDIERAFPGVQPVCNGISVIKFLRGADYQSINQCSRSMDVVLSTSVQSVPIKYGSVGDQTGSPIGVSVDAAGTTFPMSATSVSSTDPLDTSSNPESGVTASSGQIAVQASRRVTKAEAEQELLSFLSPEEDSVQVSSNICHSFANILDDGHQVQDLGAIVQLQEELSRLQKEMFANQEAIKRLEKQVLGNQEEMKGLQQIALPQIGVLRSRVQSILTHTYEIHEYPISRLFAVLPQDPSCWDALNPFSNKFRLYFLCECGDHTKSIKSTGRHEIHFAKHEGYEITRPSEFFQQYGQYILTLLKMLKARLFVAGVAVPALSNLFPSNTIDKARISLTQLRDNIEYGMDLMIGLMEANSVNEGEAVDGFSKDMKKNEVLEGVDLRKLGAFLKKNDDTVLGNLYRTVTDEGYIKWVCIDHYRVNYQESSAKEFQRVLDSIGGSFSENDGRVVVRLRSSALADQFYSALKRARSAYELDINFDWDCIASDLEALEGALRNSRVSVLRLDLQLFRTSIASSLLPTPTQYEVLFRIRDLPQVKAFHIVLSEENIEFPGISPNTSTHGSKISWELKLREIEDEIRDIRIITKVLKTNSTLTTLDLSSDNIGDDGAKALAEALKINSNLTTLDLRYNNIGVDGAKALAETLKINSTLTTLDMNDNNIGVEGAKALAEALKINSTMTTMYLRYNNIGVDGAKALAEALKINSTLTTLSFEQNNIGVEGAKALAEALKINSTLTTVKLEVNKIGDDGSTALAEALKINSTLTTLYLDANKFRVDGVKALAEALKINSTLNTLYLNHNDIGIDGAEALAEALKINPNLTTLYLNDNDIGDDEAKALAEGLKSNSTLITLDLTENHIGDAGAKTLAEALKINSTLTTLNFEQNKIGDDGAKALAEALKINSTLISLRLNINIIRDDGAMALAEALKINPNLTILDLSDNDIRVNGGKALAEALKINSNLTTLNFRFNCISDDGAEALAEALRINSNLTTLNLCCNQIGDDGAKMLAEVLKINSTLTNLNLEGNDIGDDGVKALAEALKINPNLTILYYEYNEIYK